MPHWEIDRLVELMNNNMKKMDFPNTMEAWLLHSQNLMLCLRSLVFVMNNNRIIEQWRHNNNKHSSKDNYTDLSHKGNVREDSTPCKQTAEMII